MNIVLDANIFISALIKDSTTRKLVVECKARLLFPEFIFDELRGHETEILEKSRLEREEYEELIAKLLRYVEIVPVEVVRGFRREALSVMGEIDKDDVLFIATALAYEPVCIWSDDKHFKQQERVRVFSTPEMVELFLEGAGNQTAEDDNS